MEDKDVKTQQETAGTPEIETAEPAETETAPKKEPKKTKGKKSQLEDEVKALTDKLTEERDAHLRLAAEYDNFRKRSQKEKDASYQNGRADAVAKLLPIYDNLERALQQPTEDAAYKKGVELTMAETMKIFESLGVTVFGERGEAFDPNYHNAVMHVDDETLGENTISQVFQRGAKLGKKVIRFAMVQVAN
ncbi:MAG: nucleotide exchange factor GrpE [Ruminococcaceae bacterium]|nr:nucleotide exchange factor GrpE [Oscillospiraceae bacterium]